MFFPVSKLFWFLAAPSHIVLWLSLSAAILLATRYHRLGRNLAIAAAAALVMIGVLPTSVWLLRPLEDRYPRPVLPARIDGILNLGGGLSAYFIESRGVPIMEQTETRLVAAFELARRHPEARVVFSGGSGEPNGGRYAEAQAAKYIFAQMGLGPPRLILEDRSRNTWENLVFSRNLVKPRPGEVWVLVTSAEQMPRAMEIAKRVGWRLIPWPSDYLTPRSGLTDFFGISRNLERTDLAIHEWIGLLAYQLSGKADPHA